ncbi:MAG TPA: chloride channel protein [Steroidobacteraceae bacterium]|jgi:H+/Cl- antiporter ClcA|nr:chloride channel protein [Steroidobacteraceae bacterium]
MRDILDNATPALLSVQRWKARLLLWLGSAAVGIAAVLFARLADIAQVGLRRLMAHSWLWPLALAPVGFFAIAWVTRRYFLGAEGSGIPQTIYTLQPGGEKAAAPLMRFRIVAARMLMAAAGLFCGGSIGREGPTAHVGAAIAYGFGRWIPHRELAAQRRMLILAGGAAGVAAAFNTPLAGIVFGIEELAHSFEERASGVTLTTVVLAGIIAIALAGNYTYFGQPVVAATAQHVTLDTFIVGAICGVCGGLFSRVLLAATRGLPGFLGKLQRRPALFALACGILIAVLGAVSHGTTYGAGYGEARSILESNSHLSWLYGPERAVATLISYLSGLPCGLFSPSLSTGAGLGAALAHWLGQSSAVPFAILGMCGYMAAVTQAPLTSLVIVMEMTTQDQMVFPLAITVIVATAVSKLISPPLYRTMAQRLANNPAYTAMTGTAAGGGKTAAAPPAPAPAPVPTETG